MVWHHLSEWKGVLADVPLGPVETSLRSLLFTLLIGPNPHSPRHLTLPPCESRKINSKSMREGKGLHGLV